MNKSSPDKPKFLTGIPKGMDNWLGRVVLAWIVVVIAANFALKIFG